MKTIVTVNTQLPGVENTLDYSSGESLVDYDIVVFDPEFPFRARIEFSGGGSCLSIESTQSLKKAMTHWSGEIQHALKAGKTIFFMLNESVQDQGTTGYSSGVKNTRTYNTFAMSNYEVLPFQINIRNTKGKHLKIVDSRFTALYNIIKDIVEYKVVFSSETKTKIFTSKDGVSPVSATMKFQNTAGSIVFLPHFDFSNMTKLNAVQKLVWTTEAIRTSKHLVNQLVEIDKILRSELDHTPKPEWFHTIKQPKKIIHVDQSIQQYENEIAHLLSLKSKSLQSKEQLLAYSFLVYENGKRLEIAIEKALETIGYKVENYRHKDLEIDHIIRGANGVRMIGESEGKDNSAIDISKFRQLESNINEDFQRDDVSTPAKGVLFGNGYRFTEPSKRVDQFTQKCLVNAKRLGTALVKTTDLYEAVLHLIDNPKDEKFKEACSNAIEKTEGDVVIFPMP